MAHRTQGSSTKQCNTDGCDKLVRARGLCSTHYNQQHQPGRHRKVTVGCAECGQGVEREASYVARYQNTYCSELCRQFHTYGSWSSELPFDHPARARRAKPVRTARPLRYRADTCEWCDAPFTTMYETTRFCSAKCKVKAKAVRRRGRLASSEGTFTWGQVTKLWMQFHRACAYCHQPTPLSEVQAEHVHPLSRGGRNDIGNILPSCMPCNADKRDLLLPEWETDRARRHLQARTTSWDATDTRYSHVTPPSELTQAA